MVLLSAGCVRGPRSSVASFVPPLSWRQNSDSGSSRETVAKVQANAAAVSVPDQASPDASAVDAAGFVQLDLESPLEPDTASLASDTEIQLAFPGETSKSSGAAAEIDSAQAPAGVADVRMQQLKAALNADAQRSATEQEAAAARHPLQVRAESLIAGAQELLRLGRLTEARRAAQQAMELAESGQLHFLPNEDRPLDLLRRIDGALEKQREQTPVNSADANPAFGMAPVVLTSIDDSGPSGSRPAVEPAMDKLDQRFLWQPIDGSSPENVATTGVVSANRPIFAQSPVQEYALELEPLGDPVLLSGKQPQEADSLLSAANELPRSELPPFRGAEETGTFAGHQPVAVAPAPPSVDDLEPLPSFPSQSVVVPAKAQPRDDAALRPALSLADRTLFLSLCAVAAIVSVVAVGLMIRKQLERHRSI